MSNPDDADLLTPVAEERYLGSLLFTASRTGLRDEALSALAPEDFADRGIGALWSLARQLAEERRRISARALREAAASNARGFVPGVLDRKIAQLEAVLEAPRHVESDVRTVWDCARRRRLVAVCDSIRQRAVAGDPGDAIRHAYDALAELEQGETSRPVRFDEMLDGLWHAIDNPEARPVYPTPWAELNRKLNGGLRGGRYYVVGARPGDGKSIMLHNLAFHHAQQGGSALVFSAEMGNIEVAGRMAASGARVELNELVTGDLAPHSRRTLVEWSEQHQQIPLVVDDRERITMGYIRSQCRRHKAVHGLDLVAIDYLQLVSSIESRTPRHEQVARISRECKLLARELDIVVVVASQLNREVARRGGSRPTMADLRESGGIEADADAVLLLARGQVDDGVGTTMPTDELHVYLDKNRQGATGQFTLRWEAYHGRLGN
ncbi:replicative DNA helicase [Actinokineospora iranica]|uniref:Replicative DNA helicase n=1 Tax=Actinokineospora iranica TaxID=1271860 RepID=A0A1G6VUT9_9PSEU|nr:DnaB-like helicase C-terminal domain-containing protein [Actinokineospora iranica]SDD56747.1 replicative DNA helicase [Actinokineospora iranica]